MESLAENYTGLLLEKNIKPSYPRIKVLEYLVKKQTHPTVEEIYNELQKEIPTLSKTTVYNVLSLFVEAGVVRVVTIEDNETRYDAVTSNHGHFKCEACGGIFDFPVDIDSFISEELSSFKINEKSVYFKGVCPDCLLNKNKN